MPKYKLIIGMIEEEHFIIDADSEANALIQYYDDSTEYSGKLYLLDSGFKSIEEL